MCKQAFVLTLAVALTLMLNAARGGSGGFLPFPAPDKDGFFTVVKATVDFNGSVFGVPHVNKLCGQTFDNRAGGSVIQWTVAYEGWNKVLPDRPGGESNFDQNKVEEKYAHSIKLSSGQLVGDKYVVANMGPNRAEVKINWAFAKNNRIWIQAEVCNGLTESMPLTILLDNKNVVATLPKAPATLTFPGRTQGLINVIIPNLPANPAVAKLVLRRTYTEDGIDKIQDYADQQNVQVFEASLKH